MSPRADYLVSFCFASDGDLATDLDALERFAASCDAGFRHWEILHVVGEGRRSELAALGARLAVIRNLRILIVSDGENLYRRRRIGAAEAIGDVVVISDLEEAAALNLGAFAEQARASGQIVMAMGETRRAERFLLHTPLRLLTDYKVSTRDLRTVALPRESLSRILARPTAAIDLRFEPKRSAERYVRRIVAYRSPPEAGAVGRRLELVAEILSASGPRFLRAFALLSFGVFLIAGLYGAYAMSVWAFDDDIQPGWLTTALSQSGLTGFLSMGFALFALVLARMLESLESGARDPVLDEIGNVAFFEQAQGLNVASDLREAGS